jgi:hypothetical protein
LVLSGKNGFSTSSALHHGTKALSGLFVGSQPISGNGGHDNYGRGEKSSHQNVRKIGLIFRPGAKPPP